MARHLHSIWTARLTPCLRGRHRTWGDVRAADRRRRNSGAHDRARHLDKKIRDRINALIESALATPFADIGKPEPPRANLAGRWSRRITRAHRLVYEVRDGREE
jgi:Txe/YoeB family toxin of toxin-antitoxin system